MKKSYVIDTSVLIEDYEALTILRNGEENEIYIPWVVLNELDNLKKDSKLRSRAVSVIKEINKNREWITILDNCKFYLNETNDNKILKETILLQEKYKDKQIILITNDEMLNFKAFTKNIKSDFYKRSIPFESDSQKYDGFIKENEDLIKNCFYWKEGKLYFHKNKIDKLIDYQNNPWKVIPKTVYQNAAFELLLDDEIPLVSIQSEAGFGKTYISLAVAFKKVLEEKKYKKIFIIKPNIDVGSEKMGFLPGNVDEKMWPYFRPIYDLITKLHEIRPANKLWEKTNSENSTLSLDPKKIEFLPINFIRGMNISDAFVIVDEIQNLPRFSVRTLLSRMGENVKCVCLGDVRQIDQEYLTEENNGLNWIVKLCKNIPNYGHIVLKGTKSRGPIADIIRNVQL